MACGALRPALRRHLLQHLAPPRCQGDARTPVREGERGGVPERAPALLCSTPALPVGQREFAAEVSWDVPNLAPGATSLLDVTITGVRQGDIAIAALASSTRSSSSTPPPGPTTWSG
jgi:hypothetical protein